MAFYVVYIEEAHPIDAWQLPVNVKQNVLYANPKTLAERTAVAGACIKGLKIDIPAVVDDLRNTTERAYTGWPDRLYVVDPDGRIAFKSAAGPYGFDPQGVEAELERLVPGVPPSPAAPPATG